MTDDVPQGTSLLKSDANEIAFLFARSVFSEDIVQQAWQLAQSRLSCSQVSAAVKAAMIKPKFRSR
jgi:high-affinity Fe2+/Pb2+ permease